MLAWSKASDEPPTSHVPAIIAGNEKEDAMVLDRAASAMAGVNTARIP
jgi:hypothetical protein